MKEIVFFMDAFVYWRTTEAEAKEEFHVAPKIEIQCPTGFDLELPVSADDNGDVMECPFTLSQSDDFKVKVTDAPPPCWPPRMLAATIEGNSKNTISIVLEWEFQTSSRALWRSWYWRKSSREDYPRSMRRIYSPG